MNRAWNLTRSDAVYRHETFSAGLRAAGFDVRPGDPDSGSHDGDVLLIWNRYSTWHSIAERFEKMGGTVLVAENGYLAPGGESPHGMKEREWYALGRGYHNDSTVVRPGTGERFEALAVTPKPWRQHGTHILIAPNRNFGTPGRIMPDYWTSETRKRLEQVTKRPIRIRPHPGNMAARVPLADDLMNCWAVVIWNSSAGIQALIAGIPVICAAPNWICKPVGLEPTNHSILALEKMGVDSCLSYDARRSALCNMANSQFHMDEIASGFAFKSVLGL